MKILWKLHRLDLVEVYNFVQIYRRSVYSRDFLSSGFGKLNGAQMRLEVGLLRERVKSTKQIAFTWDWQCEEKSVPKFEATPYV